MKNKTSFLLFFVALFISLISCEKICDCDGGPISFNVDLWDQNDQSVFNHPDFDTNSVRTYYMENGVLKEFFDTNLNVPNSVYWEWADSSIYLRYGHWPNNKKTGMDTHYFSFYPNDIDTFVSYFDDRDFIILFNNKKFTANENRIITIIK